MEISQNAFRIYDHAAQMSIFPSITFSFLFFVVEILTTIALPRFIAFPHKLHCSWRLR